jgi:hypothetical protein
VPVSRVEGRGVHSHQHIVGPDLGQVGFHELKDIRRAEPFLGDRLHQVSTCYRAPSVADTQPI